MALATKNLPLRCFPVRTTIFFMTKISKIDKHTSFTGIRINFGPKVTAAVKRIADCSTPTQRFVIGSSAFFLQSEIDLRNKNVPKETSTLNASRSQSRAIVGTVTGIAIRQGFISFVEKYATKTSQGKLEKFFTCKSLEKMKKQAGGITQELLQERIKGYSKALGTSLALCAMLFTNFLVDVPLIAALSKKIHKLRFEKGAATGQGIAIQDVKKQPSGIKGGETYVFA